MLSFRYLSVIFNMLCFCFFVTSTSTFSSESYYACSQENTSDCPLEFFVLVGYEEINITADELDVEYYFLTQYRKKRIKREGECRIIENKNCLSILENYYGMYGLNMLPFPFSEIYKGQKNHTLIYINLDGSKVSNSAKDICEHVIAALTLVISLRLATDNIGFPLAGLALYVSFFATYRRIYKWWYNRNRRFF